MYVKEGRKFGFDIRVRVQPAQKMEFNFCDLAFFRSLQSDVVTHDKTTKKDLITRVVVKRCFAEYDFKRMDACCR